jgi:YegS/Rv2252/BmrU family lipid kinase
VERVEMRATSARGDATVLAREAVAADCDLIVACGGDGTFNEVIRGMAGSSAALLTLPAGTANVLAEEVGFPMDAEKVAALLPDLTPFPVRLGAVRYERPQAGCRHFLLMCGAGVDASIVYHLDSKLKPYLGQAAYFLGSLEQLQRKFEPFQIRIDGREYQCTFALMSKSRRYGGKLIIASHAHLLEEEFEVVVFEGDSPLRYVAYLAQIATGTLDQFEDVSFHKARRVELSVSGESRVYIQVDGEFAGRLPAVVEAAPETLTLLIPPAYAKRLGTDHPLEQQRASGASLS